MASIRVNSGVLRIEVNDKGDTVILRQDINFINSVKSFIAGLDALQKEFDERAAQIAPEDSDAKLDLIFDLHKELHDGLDFLFGKDTCKKVFGDGEVDVIPTMDAVVDFIQQLTPYVHQLTESMAKGSKNMVAQQLVKESDGVAEVTEFPTKVNKFSSLRQQLGMEIEND